MLAAHGFLFLCVCAGGVFFVGHLTLATFRFFFVNLLSSSVFVWAFVLG